MTLAGVVRGVAGATLEQRPLGGPWQPVGAGHARGDGAARSPKPAVTTDYRLATAAAAAALRADPRRAARSASHRRRRRPVTGTVQPAARRAAPVADPAAERRPDAGRRSRPARVDADGTFVGPGAARARRHVPRRRWRPGAGYVAGAHRRKSWRAEAPALLVARRSPRSRRAAPAAAFAPTDPLAPKQWYLAATTTPSTPGRAADDARAGEGRDRRLRHRRLAARLRRAASPTRAASSAATRCVDTEGHGTFVAGDDRRATSTTQGIVGIALHVAAADREGREARRRRSRSRPRRRRSAGRPTRARA